MAADPQVPPPPSGPSGESLEDRVYRSVLTETDRGPLRASPWTTIPVALAVAAGIAGLATLMGRGRGTGEEVLPSVAVVLQEGPEPKAPGAPAPPHGPAPRPAPAPAAPRPQPVAPAPAPAPEPPRPQPAPPPPSQEAVPEAAPKELPKVDQSRLYGGAGGAGGAPAGTGGPGSTGGVAGGTGTGAAPDQALEVSFDQVGVKFRPPEPPYPPLARSARVQGTVKVLIEVDAKGVPTSARALQGPFMLRAPAVAHAMTWRFNPYLQNGVPRSCQFILYVAFSIQ